MTDTITMRCIFCGERIDPRGPPPVEVDLELRVYATPAERSTISISDQLAHHGCMSKAVRAAAQASIDAATAILEAEEALHAA